MATWIVVADENRGRIFEAKTSTSELLEHAALVHPESRLPERELTSDAPGRNQSGAYYGSHQFNEAGDVSSEHARRFAKEVVSELTRAKQQRLFRDLILVAAPRFLGILRKQLHSELRRHICLELDKDLTKLKADELRNHLPKRLPLPRKLIN